MSSIGPKATLCPPLTNETFLLISPDEQHESMSYIHAYISFSYRKNKPYLGVYLQSFETGDWHSGKHDPFPLHSLLTWGVSLAVGEMAEAKPGKTLTSTVSK